MKTTDTMVKKVAQRELFKEFGFKPALKDIVLLESSNNISYIDFVAFAINGKGYSWRYGENCIKNKAYDLAC